MSAKFENIVGVVLAGGKSIRMGGGDKCLLELNGRYILDQVIDRVKHQVNKLVLNANGDASRFRNFNLPVVNDSFDGFAGPLAGILTGMEWTIKNEPEVDWIATFASDVPFLPLDTVEKLSSSITANCSDMACAMSGGRYHPVIGLWPVRLYEELLNALTNEGIRKIDDWTIGFKRSSADFSGIGIDPFFNINRPEDLTKAIKYLISIQKS